MNRIANVIKLLNRDKHTWMTVPAGILGSSFIVNVIIGFGSGIAIYTGGLSSIFIYMLVLGIIVLPQTFPFAISFSIRRTDYFIGTVLNAILSSALVTLILMILAAIEDATNGWGVQLHFFNLPFLTDGNLAQEFLTEFILLLTMFLLGFAIGSVFRKFRAIGLFVTSLAAMIVTTLLVVLATLNNWWEPIWNWLQEITAFELSLWLLPIALCFAILSFLLIRRSTV
ncbi:hypothetical protein SAMN05216378_5486 [Paenibacillus catalpae]|uniref:ABC-2 family transporter protein n=1 Tax=Paenibacillus catalpae TaxID=1045775 RepID=A0A1I2GVN0_9BACL|nr:hypothetical protein [Paenibacillus catalpae]SFF21190.1 hypothetical protein SAMN05216378_5486 [Paenibacillus catalpae]